MYGTRAQNGTRHSLLSQFIFISFARPVSPYCEEYVYTVCTHNLYDCVEIVYELPLLQINTVSETFLHKSEAMRSADWLFIIGVLASR